MCITLPPLLYINIANINKAIIVVRASLIILIVLLDVVELAIGVTHVTKMAPMLDMHSMGNMATTA